jgi:hypothetical protein
MEGTQRITDDLDRLCRVAASSNKAANRTPKAWRFWFPTLSLRRRLPPVAKARRECKVGLEHGQICSWPVALEPQSGSGASLAPPVLPVAGVTGSC